MTNFAVCVESQFFVIGVLSVDVIVQMTEDTIRWKMFRLPTLVAVRTGDRAVLSFKRKFCMGIFGTFPAVGFMTVTYIAFNRVISLSVVRIPGIIVILGMTGKTGGGDSFVLSSLMTIRTTGNFVHSFQKKLVMVKDSSFPAPNVNMTDLALCRKSCSHMIRVAGSFIVIAVATVTISGRSNKIPVFMALNTVQSLMPSLKSVSGNI